MSCELYSPDCGSKSGSSACGGVVDLRVCQIALEVDFALRRAFVFATIRC
jgi:hypothetical protein